MKNKKIRRVVQDRSKFIEAISEAFCAAIDNAWSSHNTTALRDICDLLKQRYQEYQGISDVISAIIREAAPLTLSNRTSNLERWKNHWRPLVIEKGLADLTHRARPVAASYRPSAKTAANINRKLSAVTKAIQEIEKARHDLASQQISATASNRASAENFLFESYKLLIELESYCGELSEACERLRPVVKGHRQMPVA